MKQLPKDLYYIIHQLNLDVKEELRKAGIVVPVKSKSGAVRVGRFFIDKNDSGFYCITNNHNEMVVDNINLPQTAAVVANNLALGKYFNDDLLDADTKYGHALFDEELHRRLAKRNIEKSELDKAELMYTKTAIAKGRKDMYMQEIAKGFEKLIRIR